MPQYGMTKGRQFTNGTPGMNYCVKCGPNQNACPHRVIGARAQRRAAERQARKKAS